MSGGAPGAEFVLLLAGVTLATFAVRASFISGGRWVKGDSLYHLAIARETRRLGHLPATIDRFILPETYAYPPLHHLIISRIPGRWDLQTQKVGFAYDALTTFAVGYAGYALGGWEAGLVAPLVYVLSPFPLTSCLATSPQPLGVFFVAAFALSAASLPSAPGSAFLPLFVLSGAAAAGAMLSHRSTSQALIPLAAAESLAYGPLDFVGPLLLGSLIALLLFRERFLAQVREHVKFVVLQGGHQLNVLSGLLKQRRFARALEVHFMPRVVAANFPLVVLVPLLLLFVPGAPLYLLLWAAGVIAMYLLWLPGRGYRHLAAAVPALSLLSAWAIGASPLAAVPLIGVPLALSAAKYLRTVRRGKIFLTSQSLSACAALDRLASDGDMVLVIPFSESYTALYFSRCKILQGSGGDPEGLMFNRRLDQLISQEGGVEALVRQYGPRFVLLSSAAEAKVAGTVLFENEGYRIIGVGSH
ncbi:MAG: hypothetical protein JRN57_04750 [Nitrososphaerota archaeon]|nr:hypothetical protein [Nitrososphaerota archaeon]